MKLLRSYIFWSHERGSVHFDVMVTLILLFVFVSPRFIDFRDKPVVTVPLHASEVLVKGVGSDSHQARFTYEVRAEDLRGASGDSQVRAALMQVIEPIAGDVTIESYKPVFDTRGNIAAYDATVIR